MMEIVCPNCVAAYEIDEAGVTETGRKVRCAACSTVWRVYHPMTSQFPAISPGTNPYATEPAEDIFGEGGPMLRQAIEEQATSTIPQDNVESIQGRLSQEGIAALDEALLSQGEELASQEQARDQSAIQDETLLPVTQSSQEIAPDTAAEPPRAKLTRSNPGGGGRKKTNGTALQAFFSWKTASIAAALTVTGVGIHQRETLVRHLPQTARLFAAIGMPVNLRGVEIRNVASRLIDDNGVSVLVIDGDLQNATKRKIDLPRLRFAVQGADGQEIYVWSAQADKNNLEPGESLNFRRRLAAPPSDGKDISVRFLTRADTTAGIK
jgi:predicted Zn finger-like uncharacterized protein